MIVQPVVEPMGRFTALFQVEHVHSKHDITCHSKSRRNKKKKIPLVTNEEVDMDLSAMDDSPVLWIRLDPDFTLIRYNQGLSWLILHIGIDTVDTVQ